MRAPPWAMAIVVLSLMVLTILCVESAQTLSADPAGLAVATLSGMPASVIAVTTTEDELNADGDCSLREAIQAANTDAAVDACPAGSGKDTVSLPAQTYTLSIPSTNEDGNADGDLDIIDDLILQGAGATNTVIQAGADFESGIARVLHLLGGSEVTVDGITIQYGLATGSSPHNRGGGIYNDGGTVTVTHSILNFNRAVGGNSIYGAGIYNDAGIVLITHSTLTMNRVEYSNDGRGGGIYSSGGVVTVDHSVLDRNSLQDGFDGYGGGMYIEGGTVTIVDSALDDNSVHGITADGGGIYNDGGTVELARSTLSNNWAAGEMGGGMGGGIYNYAGALTITRSTLADNLALGADEGSGAGGGLYNSPIGTVLLVNSTLSGNRATDSAMGDPGRGGGILNNSGAVTLKNSTLSENEASTGGGILAWGAVIVTNSIIAGNADEDCDGTIVSHDYNVGGDYSCNLTQAHDQFLTDPKLDPLADNGGPTWTHALREDSPAIDAGNCSGGTIAQDQRGATRPQGGVCDIGAYEYGVLTIDDTYGAAEDTALTVAAPGVLWNDFGFGGLTATLGTTPTNGALALHIDGSFVYTPSRNFDGVDCFTYLGSDGPFTDTATVTITIAAVNDAPVAAPDTYTTTVGATLTVMAPGVLQNDVDVEDDPLQAILHTPPQSGTLTLNPDGSFVYIAAPGPAGVDGFEYYANDGSADSDPATVTLVVRDAYRAYLPTVAAASQP